MRKETHKIFDDTIIGTAVRYTNSELNRVLGAADYLGIQAYTTNVNGSSPVLTIQSEVSCDGQTWTTIQSAEITASPPVDEMTYTGSTGFSGVGAANLRYKISMTGTNPECRLRLYATLREIPTDKSLAEVGRERV